MTVSGRPLFLEHLSWVKRTQGVTAGLCRHRNVEECVGKIEKITESSNKRSANISVLRPPRYTGF